MLHQSSYENTIARIRSQVYEHRINLSELFHDFDKLRSGTVQINQFKRCIALIMDRAANPLNEQDYAILIRRYGTTVNGAYLARWCEFQKTIDKKVFKDETTRSKLQKSKNSTPEIKSVIKNLNESTKSHLKKLSYAQASKPINPIQVEKVQQKPYFSQQISHYNQKYNYVHNSYPIQPKKIIKIVNPNTLIEVVPVKVEEVKRWILLT